MDIAAITPQVVRDSLARLKRGKDSDMHGCSLLDMELLATRLRARGEAVSLFNQRSELTRLLKELLLNSLALHRDVPIDRLKVTTTKGGAEALLAKDFVQGAPDLEAWSSLYHRYVSEFRLSMQQLSALAKPGYEWGDRHVRRRLDHGYMMLAQQLRILEHEAVQGAGRMDGAPAAERVRVEERAPEAHVPSSATASDAVAVKLLAAVLSDSDTLVLSPAEARDLTVRPARSWTDHRLAIIAEGSLPRYHADRRLLTLTVLLDQGIDQEGERWLAASSRFQGLADALACADAPVQVLLGAPGSGKSTLLRQLERDLAITALRHGAGKAPAPKGPDISFMVPLNIYGLERDEASPSRPGAWLAACWQDRHPQLPPLAELLQAGRMLLLLDGLNELPRGADTSYWAAVGQWKTFAQDLAVRHPGNRIVFSCRSLDYSVPLSSAQLPVPQIQIQPLSDQQIHDHLLRVHPRRATDLWTEILSARQVEVLRTPMLLNLFLQDLAETGKLPAGRAGLLTGFVRQALRRELERDNPILVGSGLLGERDRRQAIQGRWPSATALPEQGALILQLERLAAGMQRQARHGEGGQVRLPLAEALDLLGRPPDPEAVIRAGYDLGVLDEDTPTAEVLFFHQLLQEYFAARSLARRPEPALVAQAWLAGELQPDLAATLATLGKGEPLPALPSSGWEETTVLAATMSPDPTAFVDQLAAFNLPLAGRAATEAAVSADAGERLRDRLAERLGDPVVDLRARLAAAEVLGRLGDPRFERAKGPDGDVLLPPLVVIPAATYPMGAAADRDGATAAELPGHQVRVASFAIGRFPVTNAEWSCFMAAGGYDDERWWEGLDARAWRNGDLTGEGARWNLQAWRRRFMAESGRLELMHAAGRMPPMVYEQWLERLRLDAAEFDAVAQEACPAGPLRAPAHWDDAAFQLPNQPVVGVSWYEARAYCRWLAAQTGRPYSLPTEAQWEAAARGPEGREFAFGQVFEAMRCNGVGSHLRRPSPVGIFPTGATPEGVQDMTGNVFEWTRSLWGEDADTTRFGYPYAAGDGREDELAPSAVLRVARGGSWLNEADRLRASFREPLHPAHRNYLFGFRVVVAGEG